MDLDVGKTPPPAYVSNLRDSSSINELDGWIETLMTCKQLSEDNVQRLCEKVSHSMCPNILGKGEGGLTCQMADPRPYVGSRDFTRRVKRPTSGTEPFLRSKLTQRMFV